MSGPHVSANQIRETLERELQPVSLEVIDDSHLHAGHAGAKEGRHFTVKISASQFHGLPRIAQHRLVYHALRYLIPQGIHALVIEAKLPDPS